MKALKPLLKSHAVHRISVWLIAQYIRLVYITGLRRYDIHPDAARYMRGEENAIFAFWHGRMMLMPCLCPPGHVMHVLISQHRDGVFISDVMREFRFKTIAGSTSKNGRAAFMAMLRALRDGDNIAITPDGPRGPLQVAAGGVAITAKLSGKPVIPITFSARRHKRARSWDRFMVALPFSRIYFGAGAPVAIRKDMEDEAARLAVEQAMNQLVEKADAALL
ncbi:MAG: lysophospholipid acyltransferase family protein [Alphaproteobacteria bacterium]|nr:lysophospholipid acyltransferase family protein [Alphaproteobacteria bacterium]